MSESKHTPGPWKVKGSHYMGYERHELVGFYIEAENGRSIVEEEGISGASDEAHANAYLIAAAPDLLMALKAFVGVAPAYAHDQSVPDSGICGAFLIAAGDFRVALAAIKKAEGA